MKGDSNNQHTLKEIKNPGLVGDTCLLKTMRMKILSFGVNPLLEFPDHINEEALEEETTLRTPPAKIRMTPEDHLEDCQEDHLENPQEDHLEEDHQGETPMIIYPDYSEEEGEDPQEEDHHLTPQEDKEHIPKDPSL